MSNLNQIRFGKAHFRSAAAGRWRGRGAGDPEPQERWPGEAPAVRAGCRGSGAGQGSGPGGAGPGSGSANRAVTRGPPKEETSPPGSGFFIARESAAGFLRLLSCRWWHAASLTRFFTFFSYPSKIKKLFSECSVCRCLSCFLERAYSCPP